MEIQKFQKSLNFHILKEVFDGNLYVRKIHFYLNLPFLFHLELNLINILDNPLIEEQNLNYNLHLENLIYYLD